MAKAAEKFEFNVTVTSREDLRVVRKGIELYTRNARAATGTLKGLGKTEDAEKLGAEADDIEQRLLAKFDEQGSLPLDGDGK
jgi:hypothetical protein